MIKLELTLEETNKVLEALGQRPYIQVFELINKVSEQAQSQVQASQQPETLEDSPEE